MGYSKQLTGELQLMLIKDIKYISKYFQLTISTVRSVDKEVQKKGAVEVKARSGRTRKLSGAGQKSKAKTSRTWRKVKLT